MIGQVQIENGQKVIKSFAGSVPSGNPVGSLLYTYKKLQPKNYLYCDGRDTTGTPEELRLYFPALYLYLGGSNVLPDYRECVAVGAEQKAVYAYIKAVDGVDISAEDTFLNTVVDCIDTKLSNAESYTLTEKDTGGLWLDGKKIYRRTLTGVWDSGNTLNVPFSITSEGIERFVDVRLSVQDPYGVVFEYYYTSSDFLNCYYSTSNQQFVLRKGSAPANPLTYYLVLNYTKTS